jgi:hypothetical protein
MTSRTLVVEHVARIAVVAAPQYSIVRIGRWQGPVMLPGQRQSPIRRLTSQTRQGDRRSPANHRLACLTQKRTRSAAR